MNSSLPGCPGSGISFMPRLRKKWRTAAFLRSGLPKLLTYFSLTRAKFSIPLVKVSVGGGVSPHRGRGHLASLHRHSNVDACRSRGFPNLEQLAREGRPADAALWRRSERLPKVAARALDHFARRAARVRRKTG